MAGDATNQIWLTSVLSDEDVEKALTLRFSMKRVVTNRKFGVIASPKVCPKLRQLLHCGFDIFFYLEETINTAGLKNENFVKLFGLTLPSFNKIVYLSPTMMVLRNSDEIFQQCCTPNGLTFPSSENISILGIQPSIRIFNILMGGLGNRNGTSFEAYVRTWDKNQSEVGGFAKIDEKYNRLLSCKTGHLRGNKTDCSIVNMVDIDMDSQIEKFDVLEKMIIEKWKVTFNEDVKPLLDWAKNSPISSLPEDPALQPIYSNEPVAIVGMSCKYPSANSVEEFWNILLNGEDGTGTPPDFRWLREQSATNRSEHRSTNAGFLKYPVEEFDSKFFGISPKELIFIDPQHRLLHEMVWEGLEDAAINPQSLEGTNGGVYIGSWLHDYKDILTSGGNDEFYRIYMGSSIGSGAARISHLLGLTGPSIATESGCSSAMVAVHLACKSLQRGETNLALACGVNLFLKSFDKGIMPMVVSADGHSKTFDAKADGFGRAEGCGVLVLKRLSDATKNGDNIWALIRGSAMVQEGLSKSMGTPTVHCESLAMTNALEDANVNPALVSFVEAHGTGTVVGDPMEVAAIAKAYHSDLREEPLYIGSVKTNVGHTESCSGITGIMKVVLSMHQEIIPAHINFETLNPAINLEAVPAQIPLKPVNWKKQRGKPRFAGVSSFGITGTDAHAIIEEPPSRFENNFACCSDIERPLHIMKISAKTEEALNMIVESYEKYLTNTDNDFKNISYTANVGRADFAHRAVIIAESKEQAIGNIQMKKFLLGESAEDIGKLCLLFTGQGSQYPGMAKHLFETSPVFRMHFEYCVGILREEYNLDIIQVLWADNPEGSVVSRTIYSQTSIFCVEYALLRLWESWGVKPDYVLGHSLGEFAAAVCAKILSVEDALRLVAERSRLIDSLPRGKMLVLKADKQRVEMLMKKFSEKDSSKLLDYAAINSCDQTVLAGDSDVVLCFAHFCEKENIKCILLEATHAFHSRHMDPILREYESVAKSVKTLEGGEGCIYISGMTGECIENQNINAQYWVQHTREKVMFMKASQKAVELGCTVFIEIGPQPVLSALTMTNNDSPLTILPSLKRNEDEWKTLLYTLGKLYVKGLKINWKELDQFHIREKVRLPHYPFAGKKYWPDVGSTCGTSIHPLVGSVIPNALSSILFQSNLNLRVLEYLKDHAIGDTVIFPGACYLEMCLAAGLATIEGSRDFLPPPTRPMKVENLTIEAPLSFDECGTIQVQTITEINSGRDNDGTWNDISVKIFRHMISDSSKWQPHAKANFSPLPTCSEKEVPFDSKLFVETLQRPSDNPIAISQEYDRLASVGLKFGPTFRSIEMIWKNTEKGTLLAKVKTPPRDSKYIVHPVVLDAMIQAIMMLRPISTFKRCLYVPIKIGKFVWISDASLHSEIYINVQSHNGNASAILVDVSGKVLSVMSSIELIDTTVKAIESILEQQTTSMPDCWEEIWKKSPGPAEFSANLDKAKNQFYTDEFQKTFENNYNTPTEYLARTYQNLAEFVYLNILRALYESGWEPEVQKSFSEVSLFNELKIKSDFRKYFSFICDVLEVEGVFHKVKDNNNANGDIRWLTIRSPPKYQEVLDLLKRTELCSDLIQQFKPTILLQKVGENLKSLFDGSKSSIGVLFPDGPKNYPSVGDFYDEYSRLFNVAQLLCFGERVLRHVVNSQSNPHVVFRFLEVGAGTGAFSEKFITELVATGCQFEYTYTDISAAFFPAAEKRFEKHLKSMKFKKLNIEDDPIGQGFSPHYFDFVLAAEVIHATKDVAESLRNIHILMKPGGRLSIMETTKINRVHTFLFGTLNGYWRFEDFDVRKKYCVLEKEAWKNVLESSGFQVEGMFSVFNNDHSFISSIKIKSTIKCNTQPKTWLLFHLPNNLISNHIQEKIQELSYRRVITVTAGDNFFVDITKGSLILRKGVYDDYVQLLNTLKKHQIEIEGIVYCWALDDNSTTQEEILLPYFNITKSCLNYNLRVTPRIAVITNGVTPLENNDWTSFHKSTLWSFTRTMKNENFHLKCKCIDVTDCKQDYNREIFSEIWNCDKEMLVAFHGGSRYVPRFQRHKIVTNALKLPVGTDRYQLVLPESKSISDLQFGTLDTFNLTEDEIEIQIKASALNFRDVLSIIKPSDDFKNVNTVGFDFAGEVKRIGENVTKWRINDRVCGCNVHFTAMPSHVTLAEDLLIRLPDNMSYSEGATMPAVYMTSVLCLIEVAKVTKEDSVLIHTASGGVGLSAIQICKHIGCKVFATAGSKRKRNYLRSLGIQHIFNSRTTQFGDQILELTDRRGVDVVLNSLTSDGFKEATLSACNYGARFIEMSKLNIWTAEDVKKLRPDIVYTPIDLSQSDRSEWIRLLRRLLPLIEQNVIAPIPYVRFDAVNIVQALEYMQKAKHIGKIVCTLPELRLENGEMKIHKPMFNKQGTYLITGGLGGIGFVVAEWMVSKGAKHIVLAGRNPPSPSSQSKINEINSKGANLVPIQLNVGEFEQCKDLINFKLPNMKLPPLKGVMHAAGILSDGLIINQEWSKLRATFDTKIQGTLNLHELTKGLLLEHFVLFSSVVALLGTTGQANHAAANAFEDALVHYRNSIGLPATTVNWGQWGEVGVAKEIDLPGLNVLSNMQGVAGLEYAMNTQQLQLTVANIESFVILSKLLPQLPTYLDESVWKTSTCKIGVAIKCDEFWQQYDSMHDGEDKVNLLKRVLGSILRNVLRMEETEIIDDSANLQEMGVDSLMFVEIKNLLQSLMGERLLVNSSSIKDCSTVQQLTETLLKLIEGQDDNTKPTLEEVNQLIREDCYLPEHIAANVDKAVGNVCDIRTVLLTGSTGTFGPYVLKKLTELPQIFEVICLIRTKKNEDELERLLKVLRTNNQKINMGKVRCVGGNMALPCLGMKKNVWVELSKSVDAVFNCAACVRHTEYYKKRNLQNDVRNVNIEGTKHLLEFACQTRLKHVYHASSLLSVVKIDNDRLSERWPATGDFDSIMTYAYPISKFVGDMLIKQAVERGIPCKVFRLPLIVGESETGRCSITNNHAMMRYLFIMKTGVMPSTPAPITVLPVDVCADLSVRIFFDARVGSDIFNISHGQPASDHEFAGVAAKFGYKIDFVEFSEFAERVQQSGSGLEIFGNFYGDEESLMDVYANSPMLRKWVEDGGSNDMWLSEKIVKLFPDFYEQQKPTMDYIYKDLLFCQHQGWFKQFGL